MKKIGITLVVLFFLCFGCKAQKDMVERSLKNLGQTLVKTDSLGGFRCDHYAREGEPGDQYRLVTYDISEDGVTYALWLEDPLGLNRIPDSSDLLFYRIYYKNGPLSVSEGRKSRHTIFPDESMLLYDEAISLTWNDFCERTYIAPDEYDLNNGRLPISFLGFGDIEDVARFEFLGDGEYGYVVEDRAYKVKVTSKGLERKAFAQLVDNNYYYICSSDTIMSSTVQGNQVFLKYKNGDYVKYGFRYSPESFPEVFQECSIHRNGGVYKYVNGDAALVFPDGSFYQGSKGNGAGLLSFAYINSSKMLMYDEWSFYNGTLTNSDGTIIKYVNGYTEEELKAKEEAQKQLVNEKNQKLYAELCEKYGRKYVDSVLFDRKPMIGMPEELFVRGFNAELVSESYYSKLYRVRGLGITGFNTITITDQALKWSIWVTDGVVSDIRYWN